jgi:hypothetical protein
MEKKPFVSDPYMDYTTQGMHIADDLRRLGEEYSIGEMSGEYFDAKLDEHVQKTYIYLSEGLVRFPGSFDFDLKMEAEGLTRAIPEEHKENFALKFNQIIYDSLGGPGTQIDAMSNFNTLITAAKLLIVADCINSNNFYKQPNKVRESGDAVVGRIFHAMIAVNRHDFHSLGISYRN